MSVHVIPSGDGIHINTVDCWCNPAVEWQDPQTGAVYAEPVVIHFSGDAREVIEDTSGEVDPGKGWLVTKV
jgi:hypothetical protein